MSAPESRPISCHVSRFLQIFSVQLRGRNSALSNWLFTAAMTTAWFSRFLVSERRGFNVLPTLQASPASARLHQDEKSCSSATAAPPTPLKLGDGIRSAQNESLPGTALAP